MFIFSTLLGDLIALIFTLVVLFLLYCQWIYQYWNKKNVPYLEPEVPYGNVANFLKGKENFGITLNKLYQEYKSRGWKHAGVYILLTRVYMVLDLEYIRNILTKDFQYFVDRSVYFNEEKDPLSAHLVNLTGDRWKKLRAKLTPTFTSGKMKMMFQTLVECEANLREKMEAECMKSEPIDIKEILACFTTDIIGSCAFGLDCKAFEQENSVFREFGRKIFTVDRTRRLKRTFSSNFPQFAKAIGLSSTPKDVEQFFMKVVKDTVKYREEKNVSRSDFMQLLIDMKNDKFLEDDGRKIQESMTINEIAAQSFVFFAAGFETSSTLMTFTLYELSKNQEIQKKAREEINTVLAKHQGKITYEAIQEMKYLSQIIDESLRLHPPVPLTNRKCIKDYKVPGTDIIIEKGTTVLIPIIGIHFDKKYYPDPEKFDPDRFSDENKALRPNYTHLPFGEGPRICIGMRFGLMQAKVGLTSLLKNFNFTVSTKTKEPLEMEMNNVIFSVKGGIWLNAQKIT